MKKLTIFLQKLFFILSCSTISEKSYLNPLDTFSTNISGTINVLESLRYSKNIRSIVIVTTDKVYENKEIKEGYKETDSLGGLIRIVAVKHVVKL